MIEINWGIVIFLFFVLALIILAVISNNAMGNIDETHDQYIDESLKHCVDFNDGRLAIVDLYCDKKYETISWFLSKGYHMEIRDGGSYGYGKVKVYMSR